jgi:serine/threonine protein kinase
VLSTTLTCFSRQYLHSKKLIHRDLKPQNLLVNNKWVCKVADFGVSTIKTTTRTMTAIGTPVYMAPEGMLFVLPPNGAPC